MSLYDARSRLEAVLNNATVAIFLMDHRQYCIYLNPAAEKLTGYTLAEIEALNRPLHDIVHHTYPDGRPFPLSECAIDRAFPEHSQTQGEEIFVHKDGSFYPVAFTASPIRDNASQTIGTIIEVRDVKEEKLAQERQRLLLNELNHRVKNTLATVQSIAWQTFKHVDRELVQSFDRRLAALSGAHNLLTQTSWTAAPLRDVVTAAIRPFNEARFSVDGPDCELHPKATVTLSMVLHELCTNALKYGALSQPDGKVAIHWTCDHGPAGSEIDLQWRESGGPTVQAPTRKGFGSRLIERQLGLEFGGQVDLDFAETGVTCRMRLIMPRAAEPLDVLPSTNLAA